MCISACIRPVCTRRLRVLVAFAFIELQLHRRMHFGAVTCIETTFTQCDTHPKWRKLHIELSNSPDYRVELESENTKCVCALHCAEHVCERVGLMGIQRNDVRWLFASDWLLSGWVWSKRAFPGILPYLEPTTATVRGEAEVSQVLQRRN